MKAESPFALADVPPLVGGKFEDPFVTAKGEPRASVALQSLDTLWFNTGTLCNLACKNCYIESSPTNDALVYITADEVRAYLDEIATQQLPTREIAFTGGEPFMNPGFIEMLQLSLERGHDVLVLTNAMRPMQRWQDRLLALPNRDRLTLRVSLDHFTAKVHEQERGPGSWDKAMAGIGWLQEHGFAIAIAGRQLAGEDEAASRAGYGELFDRLGLSINAGSTEQLILFPEMDEDADIPEITDACWGILDVAPASIMCSSSRMVVKRKGEPGPRVAACTLLPYDPEFDLGTTLQEASRSVQLNHPHCARFCVLGGASCSA